MDLPQQHPTAEQLAALAERDPVLGAAMERVEAFPGFPSPEQAAGSHYQHITRAIIGQQLSTKAARTIHGRIVALTDGPHFPTPEELEQLDDTDLRGAGTSRPKIRAIRDLAARLADGRLVLDGIEHCDDDEVIERLVTVKGIGVWSAQMFLMFRLGRLDVLASGDLGVREGLKRLDGLDERPSAKEVDERGRVWSPLSSVACWVLWRLTEEPR